ncbi:MAG: ABC transporter permease [Planctomycetaceae bacterium]|nr:ABC transporter permease [Planctomycetaceae bacterium]
MRFLPELPLLRRELTELANRRRTYVIRVIGAVIILLVLFLAYSRAMQTMLMVRGGLQASWQQLLGIGGDIFLFLAPTLFYSIQILMPALCCAAVSAEKENNTIGTLLLTRLSPLTIVLEKLGSRLVPMMTLLLITFPVLAYVFSLGGVDTNMLIATLWLLFCECLLFSSIALLCSVWFPTTVGAFIWSYVLIGIFAAFSLSLNFRTFVPSALWNQMVADPRGWAIVNAYLADPINTDASEWLPAWIRGVFDVNPSLAIFLSGYPWMLVVCQSVMSLLISVSCLFLACLLLVPRAFVSNSSLLLKVFGRVDAFFKALNERTTGGVELIADSNSLPGSDPVAWRERAKKSLGKARYLFRILVVLEVPTLFICMFTAILSSQQEFRQLYVLLGLIWVLAILVIGMKGATLFSSERARETIEPLLASPMKAVDMVRQKVSGMSRLLIVMATPILTVNFTLFCLRIQTSSLLSSTNFRAVAYLAFSVVNAFGLLYLVAWIATGIGLKIHSQTKAVLAATSAIALWAVTPFVFLMFSQMSWSFGVGVAVTVSGVCLLTWLVFCVWSRPEASVVVSGTVGVLAGLGLFSVIIMVYYADPNMYVAQLLQSLSPASLVVGTESYLLDVSYRRADVNGFFVGTDRFPWLLLCCCRLLVYGVLLLGVVYVVRRFSPIMLNRLESREISAVSSPSVSSRVPVLEGATQT